MQLLNPAHNIRFHGAASLTRRRPVKRAVMPLKLTRWKSMKQLLGLMLGTLLCGNTLADENDFRCFKSVGNQPDSSTRNGSMEHHGSDYSGCSHILCTEARFKNVMTVLPNPAFERDAAKTRRPSTLP